MAGTPGLVGAADGVPGSTGVISNGLSAGGGALILRKGMDRNLLLGSHLISDGSLARTAGVEIGGTVNPITSDNLDVAYKSLRLLEPEKMKARLNEVSQANWMTCINKALVKSSRMLLNSFP